ncbi:hypothetical protein D0Y65_018056 [Glycine soja]|uniref:Bet v I/Major latex protein domain-containing protein n=2 Tax=Glycine subgen. Soja TaxID=1462606 RepID=A0A0R0J437_SOYBN|nr:hypothetical protein D0Y65_018056 [Glycine soja]
MALSGKVETQVEIQAPAAKFYYVFRKQLHHVPNGAKVHDADWENVGSVKHWDFTIDVIEHLNSKRIKLNLKSKLEEKKVIKLYLPKSNATKIQC